MSATNYRTSRDAISQTGATCSVTATGITWSETQRTFDGLNRKTGDPLILFRVL